MTTGTPSSRDFDLHRLVRVRVTGGSQQDLRAVSRQLGLEPVPPTSEPDIAVRFVDRIDSARATYVGYGHASFDRTRFSLLTGRDGSPRRTVIPFDRIGLCPEIVCEHGLSSIPHLLAVVNLTALSKGVLPLHASAFSVDGVGYLVTGWAKSGKTEALLAALRRGGAYVGDEWVYLFPDGTMRGIAEPIRLWGWHLRQLDELRGSRTLSERMRVVGWETVARLARTAESRRTAAAVARKAAPVLERQAYVRVPPRELFGADAVREAAQLDAVALLMSSDSPDTVVEDAAPGELSSRMKASLADERAAFLADQRQFQYAFPDRRCELALQAETMEATLLADIFDQRRAVKVTHPYPCDIDALGDAVMSGARTLARTRQPEQAVRP